MKLAPTLELQRDQRFHFAPHLTNGYPRCPRIERRDLRAALACERRTPAQVHPRRGRRIRIEPRDPRSIEDRCLTGSAIDGRTTRHPGYKVSQRKRKRIEEVFGWLKTVGALRKTRHRGVIKVGWVFTFAASAYNLVRMRTLLFPPLQSA